MPYYPGAKLNKMPYSGGSYVSGYEFKFVEHTTESSTFTPRSDNYFGHSGWPHFTLERNGVLWQHLSTSVAARALRNASGGVQTNRGRAIQMEIVGYARTMPDGLTREQRNTLAEFAPWLYKHHGIVLDDPGVVWSNSNAYGLYAPQRFSNSKWISFNGICGHQHVPENTHWDPGKLPPSTYLSGTTPTPSTPKKDWFDMASIDDLKKALTEVLEEDNFYRIREGVRLILTGDGAKARAVRKHIGAAVVDALPEGGSTEGGVSAERIAEITADLLSERLGS